MDEEIVTRKQQTRKRKAKHLEDFVRKSPWTDKLSTRADLLNLQELINPQHRESAESIQRYKHTLISTVGFVTQATYKKGWQPYTLEDNRIIYIYTW